MKKSAEELILSLTQEPHRFSDHYDLLTHYFEGYSLETLKTLINHPHERVSACGIWISSELSTAAQVVLPDVVRAIPRVEPRIRLDAFDLVLMTSIGQFVQYFRFLVNGLLDDEKLIRTQVMFLISNAEDQQLLYTHAHPDALIGPRHLHIRGLQFLINGPPPLTMIEKNISSNKPLIRKYAAIASKRFYNDHEALKSHLRSSNDSDLRQFVENSWS